MLHEGVSGRLRDARKALGLSRRALAAQAGLSAPVVAYVETGRLPKLDTIAAIAQAVGVSAVWLAYGREGGVPFAQKRPKVSAPPIEPPPWQDVDVQGVGGRLRSARTARNFTRRGLGKIATSDTTIRQIEEGDIIPSIATIEQLAVSLGIAPGWLAYGEGSDPLDA